MRSSGFGTSRLFWLGVYDPRDPSLPGLSVNSFYSEAHRTDTDRSWGLGFLV